MNSAEYTDHQQSAIKLLKEWKVGALFMEPGTGKTRVAVTLANSTPCNHVFWIGPLRTLNTIQDEAEKWGGFSMPVTYCGVESISASDRIWLELLDKVEKADTPFVVVDESLKIKNAKAKRTQRLLEIGKHVEWKLILNGTPISRNLLDMWPQMEFLSPKILGMSLTRFKYTFCKITTVTKSVGYQRWKREYITGMENVDYLHSLIRHYVYECDLKLNISQKWHTEYYTISDENKEKYREIKEKYLSDETLEFMSNNIFFAMTTEMQVAYAQDESKIEAVKRILEDCDAKKTIIFCRFVASAELCRKNFPECAVLSMQKESLGLNLQEYSTTIYFDKVWDYALYTQSTRRTYRTGQEHDCTYYELTGDVGLESMIDRNIAKKVSMSEYLKKVSIEDLKKEL
ncbi:MAG: DEAD/DEAH box helicase [Clostridia bacterium]|nr:DEAD/DEAH box helicase [Clostridia bacterium]